MKMHSFVGIIPARYPSSRFPGKPLCDIFGLPMIVRVYNSVKKWDKWQEVYVATDDSRIIDTCSAHGIPAMLTKETHQDCLDRAAEVVDFLEEQGTGADRYIVIQGDEPLFNVDTLNTDLSPSIVNFYTEVKDVREKYDSNAVKVVVSMNKKAIYFSRYSVPYHDEKTKRTDHPEVILKQIGVYSFSAEMLKTYTNLNSTPLENLEGIGLNRLLEHDIEVHMRYTEHDSISVDTPEDRNRILELIREQYEQDGKILNDDGTVMDKAEQRKP